jgi:hypothetical protein
LPSIQPIFSVSPPISLTQTGGGAIGSHAASGLVTTISSTGDGASGAAIVTGSTAVPGPDTAATPTLGQLAAQMPPPTASGIAWNSGSQTAGSPLTTNGYSGAGDSSIVNQFASTSITSSPQSVSTGLSGPVAPPQSLSTGTSAYNSSQYAPSFQPPSLLPSQFPGHPAGATQQQQPIAPPPLSNIFPPPSAYAPPGSAASDVSAVSSVATGSGLGVIGGMRPPPPPAPLNFPMPPLSSLGISTGPGPVAPFHPPSAAGTAGTTGFGGVPSPPSGFSSGVMMSSVPPVAPQMFPQSPPCGVSGNVGGVTGAMPPAAALSFPQQPGGAPPIASYASPFPPPPNAFPPPAGASAPGGVPQFVQPSRTT